LSNSESIIRAGSTPAPGLRIALSDWAAAAVEASRIRLEVFVREQAVPLELELDRWDPLSVHALATAAGGAVGTARLLPDGHIGRMAVLRAWRRRGAGRALLDALLEEAGRAGHREAIVNAQTYVVGFYERAGFTVCSEVFDEAGIPHVEMRRPLAPAAPPGGPRR